MPTNYVLVDFENVQPELSSLAGTQHKVKVFFGAKQQEGRVPYKLMKAMVELGENVELVEVKRSGKNALDMHIAYFLGKLLQAEPDASIHIISADTDFDPLLEYLSGKANCRRTKSITELTRPTQGRGRAPPAPKAPKAAKSPRSPRPAPAARTAPVASRPVTDDRFEALLKHLRSNQDRPSNRKKLAKFIATHLSQRGPAASAGAIEDLIDELVRRGLVTESGTKLTYNLG